MIEIMDSDKSNFAKQYFVDKAVDEAAFILERIDKRWPLAGPSTTGGAASGMRGGLSLPKRRLSGTWEPETAMLTEKPQVEATTRARVRKRSFRVGLPHSSEEAG
jgi:hypothetical protein